MLNLLGWRRIVALTTASVALLASIALAALPAEADTAPVPGTPSTVSSDSLPAPQINGVVWTQVVIGSTVYAGGNFTQAQPSGAAAGVGTVSRSALLAYSLTTGALISTFAPSFNAQVRGLAASPDGSTVYAVGDFTTVSGTSHSHIVALSASTGAVRTGFTASANASVFGVTTSGGNVFFGGNFTSVNGVARTRAAAVSGTSGALAAFAPVIPDYTVRALVVSPDGSKVVLGGSFSSLNGGTGPGRGLGAVDSATGKQNQAWNVGKLIYDHGANSAIYSLWSDGTNVYGTGYVYGSLSDGNLEGTFNATWASGTLNWLEDCHGDSYSVATLGDAVYSVSHAHYCGDLPNGFPQTDPSASKALKQHALAFSKATTGTLAHDPYGAPYADFAGQPAPTMLSWYPDLGLGTFTGQNQAAWSVTTSASGYVLLGGEFPTVNGQRQVGLARFAVSSIAPNKDGPRLSGTDFSTGTNWKATAVSQTPGSVLLTWPSNWDRDNANLTYTVKRAGTTVFTTKAESEGFWLRPTLSWTDTGAPSGSTVGYTVTATDPFGNSATTATASVTVAGAPATNAAPSARFGATTSGLAVSVDGTSSTDSDGTVTGWSWSFGDGATATGSTATHTYAAAGSYSVTLTVTDDKGATGATTQQVAVGTATTAHIAADAFGRTVAGGFGAADTGGAWTVSNGASNYSVGSGVGTFTDAKGGTQTAFLGSVSAPSTDATVSIGIPVMPVGGAVYAGVVGRRIGTDDYSGRVVVSENGSVVIQVMHGGAVLKSATLSGVTAHAGSVLDLRLQTVGSGTTTVQARAWVDATTQPGVWQVSATDTTAAMQGAGSVGLRTYLGGAVSNGPLAITFDDLVVDPLH